MRTYLDAPDGWTCREFVQGAKVFLVYPADKDSEHSIGFIQNFPVDGEARWFYAAWKGGFAASLPHWLGPGYLVHGEAIRALIAHSTQEVTP